MLIDWRTGIKWAGIAVAVVILLAGVIFLNHWIADKFAKPSPLPSLSVNLDGKVAQKSEPQLVYVGGGERHTREIVYMNKEVDPKTGQMEKTDVQFDRRENKVYVKVNGKEFEVPADVKEGTKFENGKLVITESTEMRLNITAPKPAFEVGLGWGMNGPAATIDGPLYSNVGWWVYGDKKTVAGGIKFPVMQTNRNDAPAAKTQPEPAKITSVQPAAPVIK